MIKIRKAEGSLKRTYAKEMKLDGFISATELSGTRLYQKVELGINPTSLVNYKNLKKKFEEEEELRCICLDYGTGCKKYWYKISDLQKLYPVKDFRG